MRNAASSPPPGFDLPWLALLTPEDQEACGHELTASALAAVESGKRQPLVEALDRWRATALATWDAKRTQVNRDERGDAPAPLPRL